MGPQARGPAGAAAAAGLTLLASEGAAGNPHVGWCAGPSWLAPPGCTDARATLKESERLLGRPLAAVAGLDFDVRITDLDGKWQLKLGTVERATGERRERVLEGKSCDEVTSAAAVALAMVIDSRQAIRVEPEGESRPSEATTLVELSRL